MGSWEAMLYDLKLKLEDECQTIAAGGGTQLSLKTHEEKGQLEWNEEGEEGKRKKDGWN